MSGRCRLLSVTESKDSVSIFYEYERSEGSMTIAQLFKFKDQKISCVFRGNWTLVPAQTDQVFRRKLMSGRSEATRDINYVFN